MNPLAFGVHTLRAFVFCLTILVLKMFFLALKTGWVRHVTGQKATPEDAKLPFQPPRETPPEEEQTPATPSPSGHLDPIERHLNAHRNDCENILPFFMAGAIFLEGEGFTDKISGAVEDASIALFVIFTGIRVAHTVVYLLGYSNRGIIFGSGVLFTGIIAVWAFIQIFQISNHTGYQIMFLVCTIILIIELFAIAILTSRVRVKTGQRAAPEDAKSIGLGITPPQVVIPDEQPQQSDSSKVKLYLNAHRNALEHIIPFFVACIILGDTPQRNIGAYVVMPLFTIASIAQTAAYLREWNVLYTIFWFAGAVITSVTLIVASISISVNNPLMLPKWFSWCWVILNFKILWGVFFGERARKYDSSEARLLGDQVRPDGMGSLGDRYDNIRRNDLENLLPFMIASLLCTFYAPPLTKSGQTGVITFIFLFTLTRVSWTIFYRLSMQPWRSIAWGLGLLATVVLLIWALANSFSY